MKLRHRSSLRLLTLALLVSSATSVSAAETVFPGLQTVLTPAEWKRAGLDRLTSDQIGVIDAALIRHLLRTVPAPAPTPPASAPAPQPSAALAATATPTADPKPKSGLLERIGLTRHTGPDWRDQPPLEARATAWLTVNRFTLDNGQVWEGTETIPFDLAGKDIVIEARPNESFALKLKSGSAPIRVRRVK
jgi:hypothetical protein